MVTYLSVGKKRVTAAIENISAGGVLLRTSLTAPVGTRIGLEFSEGGAQKTRIVNGVVMTVAAAGVGVKFDNLSIEVYRRLLSLIRSMEEASGETLALQRAPARAPPPADAGSGVKRRRNRRVAAKDATAHLRFRNEAIGLSVPVSNVSMGGLFLQTSDQLPLRSPIDVELTLAGQSMVISGEVVGALTPGDAAERNLVSGLSMRFGPMKRRTADRLRAALSALAPHAAEGLAQESPPEGYVAEMEPAAAPAPIPAAPGPANSTRYADFDFEGGDLSAVGDPAGNRRRPKS